MHLMHRHQLILRPLHNTPIHRFHATQPDRSWGLALLRPLARPKAVRTEGLHQCRQTGHAGADDSHVTFDDAPVDGGVIVHCFVSIHPQPRDD